ncbi:hypothetical protein OAG92_00975 [Akkermansiaceae bacterium]|nr:hypothetical protein [Akkermansiaceae bacterium]MDB4535590.1 hypothetical protein [bacterium]MDB4633635.1 hypothetical protein [Akkermansiaceae bacterium]MDB4706667.1 hypothetical protein [Akkermansiaceae bacterium]MDB4800793.1 hypothetical protein [Akkermansiaceae bacterium]
MDEAVEKLLPAIEEQLNSPETPYVREAFDRILTKPDIEEEEAKAMLAFCLADEVETMMADERDFDSNRYQMLLELLPVMPEGR